MRSETGLGAEGGAATAARRSRAARRAGAGARRRREVVAGGVVELTRELVRIRDRSTRRATRRRPRPAGGAPRGRGPRRAPPRARHGPERSPRRPPAGRGRRRPALCLTGPPRHGPARRQPTGARPVRRRDRRRPPVRARDERHEGRHGGDRGRGGADRRARRGRAGLEVVLCAGEETGCDGALALTREDGALGRVRRGAGGRADDELSVRRAQGRRVGRRGRAREDRARVDAAPRRERDLQARAGDHARSTDFAFDVDTHPLLGAPTSRSARSRAASTSTRCPTARRGGDRRPHRAGARRGRRRSRARGNGSARRCAAVDRAWRSTRSTPTPPTTGCRTVFAVMGRMIGEAPEPRGLAYFTDAAALVARPTARRRRSSAAPATPTRRTAPTSRARCRRSRRPAEGFFEVARRWCGL